MGYWRRQTCMHQRQTRLPSVTVSACTLPVCQNWSVYRGKAPVSTNHMRTVPAARVRTRFSLLPKSEFTAEWEDANQSMRAVHVHAYALLPKFEQFTSEWRECLYLMSTHGDITYCHGGMGSPSHLLSA